MRNHHNTFRNFSRLVGLIAIVCCIVSAVRAQVDEKVNPITTCYANVGLTQTSSAEALGSGRLTINAQAAYYQQIREFLLAPNKNAHIITNVNALSFGVNNYIDIFGSLATFGSIHYKNSKAGGIGAVNFGIQGSLPFEESAPIRLAGQFTIFGGTSMNQINENNADGFNFFETRTGYDFTGRLLQTFILGSHDVGVKLHFNEGILTTLQSGKDMLLLFAAGIQFNFHPVFVMGCEVNSRTSIKKFEPFTDPFWVTPSMIFRTPYHFNFYVAGDIALSQERDNNPARALEPYRIITGLTFTFDLLAGKRKAFREKNERDSLERIRLAQETKDLQFKADSIAQKAKSDSLELAYQIVQQQRQADSIANKMRQDSILLAETQARLKEEKSKRSDAEKQLLSTGLLLLDAVFFETGKTEISINSKPYLNIIGKMLLKYPKLQLQVAGHTDNIGGYEYNMNLSRNRAQSVRDYLVTVAPDLATRLIATGYGSTQPKADNTSANGRKLNRRVELQVMNKDALKEYNQ